MKYIKLIFILFIICSCVSETNLINKSFRYSQRSLEDYILDKDLHEIIELVNIKIIIVGDRTKFKWDTASVFGSPVVGYATNKNEIYLFGYKDKDGKIILNQFILGHELNHLLNFKNKKIANPDKL